MVSSAKRAKRKRLAQEAQQRETSRSSHQMDPVDLSEHGTDLEEEDDPEILFPSRTRNTVEPPPSPARVQATTDCEIINMVKTLNGAVSAVSQHTAQIQRAYQQLCAENVARDKALADLTAMVKEYSSSPVTTRSHPTIQADVLDEDGNLRAADIGITWEGNETFLPAWRPGGWLKFPATNNVHTLSTEERQRPGQHVYNSSTANAGNTGHNPGCRCPDTSFFPGDASGVSAGCSNPEIQ